MHQPYDHQQEVIKATIEKLRHKKSVLIQASTGFGKTIVSACLVDHYLEQGKRILFVVDSEDLISQTSSSFIQNGIINEGITSRIKRPKHFADCYVAMVETLNNRLSDNPNFLKNIDLIISDEAHILVHEKIYKFFPDVKIIALTATPIIMKRLTFFKCDICRTEYQENTNCCGIETMEWTKPYTMSQIYDDIVVGKPIDWLIDHGYLCRDISLVKKSVDTSGLKKDSSGDFTNTSQNHAFGAPESITALVNDYREICHGKKTLIFTPSTKINKMVLAEFERHGIDARSFDTRHNSKKERIPTLKWFRNNRDAILINTGCFIKGLDVTDIEAIIGYLSTDSLSKYIQFVGRGGRPTKNIFKDSFIHMDYGDNIDRLGEWSDPTRDWESIFYNGLGKPKPKREALEAVNQCDDCGALYPSSQPGCPHCGAIPKPKKKREPRGEEYELVPIAPMPPPSGRRIVEYTRSQDKDVNFAFKVLTGQVVDLFRFYGVKADAYHRSIETGEFRQKVEPMIRKAYFVIIRSGLDGANRRLSRVVNDIKSKLDKIYENSKEQIHT